MRLMLEMFLWTIENEKAVRYYHLQTDITESRQDPDTLMNNRLAYLGGGDKMGARYAHSTSWRYESGRTLLTYLIWCDRHLLEHLPSTGLFTPSVVSPESRGPLCPRPEKICETHVLIHGLRHIRYLVFDQNDIVAAKILECSVTSHFLYCLDSDLSGRFCGPVESSKAHGIHKKR